MKNSIFAFWIMAVPVILLLVTGCTSKGVIRGRVLVSQSPGFEASRTDGDSSAANTVVFIARDEPTQPPATSKTARVAQTEDGFRPQVLPVTRGTEVEFHNQGEVYHNAFSLSPVKKFDIGSYAPGDSRSVLFEQLGIVNVFCELHPASAGYVVVLPDHNYAQPDATGAFSLPKLPVGTYTVKAWHPIFGEISRSIDLSRNDVVDLTLEF